MKKKLIWLLLLASCGYAPIDNSKPIVIKEIEKKDGIYCDYYGTGNFNMAFMSSSNFCFRDTCGKFQIGDTLNIVK